MTTIAKDGYELAKAIVEYFGNGRIDPLLTSDIILRNKARTIIAKVEG